MIPPEIKEEARLVLHPQTLHGVILSNPDASSAFDAGEDGDVVAALVDPIHEKRDSTRYTSAYLSNDLLGLEHGELVFATIKRASEADSGFPIPETINNMREVLNAGGLDFSTPKMQAQIVALAQFGQWPDEVRDKLLGLGIKRESDADQKLERDPTVEDVAGVRRWLANRDVIQDRITYLRQQRALKDAELEQQREAALSSYEALASRLAGIQADIEQGKVAEVPTQEQIDAELRQ